MTITEFLLARIAEDEGAAQRAKAAYYGVGGGGLRWGEVGYETAPHLTIDPGRVLAECEARRGVLADPLLHTFISGEGLSIAGYRIVRTLAAVYSDHPDYRDEWRA